MRSHEVLLASLEEAVDLLETRGIHAMLGFLNSRAPHRFTGVYRLDVPLLRNLYLYDRENPSIEVGADAPLRETYCSIVGSGQSPFATGDAAADPELGGHPARETTLAYCGVPLRGPDGTTFGTLCHFDLVPRPVPRAEIPLMEAVAPHLVERLEF